MSLMQKTITVVAKKQFMRTFTTAGSDSLNKLRNALESYRIENYQQELPSRCKKDVLNAAAQNEIITTEGIVNLLSNIGAENKVSRSDVDIILSEIREESSSETVRVDQMMQIL